LSSPGGAIYDGNVLLPWDAMLVLYMLSSCVCPSVCPSHAGIGIG